MWDMILTISKDRQHYAKISLQRDYDVAVAQARDFVRRFPESEGFRVTLYRYRNDGEPIAFQDIAKV
ncbi:hypothetical protein EV677_2585 [Herminiimonas fonticola]|uniref:Uncharacterized protein n=1 Tax=Herminiimonas fonticola TaxID=303380 RepID=A0A4R6G3Q8_9BURK|nr:hypothetical protein Hfont_2621 [Herminiimonas fonticola]TDN88997.1 hypothetical protein EV677_2585 [Herminiimonas fonticola]